MNNKKLIAIARTALCILVLGTGSINLLDIAPVAAQRVSPGDVWQQVYQQLPDFPKENQYISQQTGKVAENNTLANRLMRYHFYVKGRSIYRFDWKLTLADYLGVNEIMYDATYPGNDTLKQNPIEGDRTAISRLSRRQREQLIQLLVNLFNSPSSAQPAATESTTPAQPIQRSADLLK
jgi:hypothetical protein